MFKKICLSMIFSFAFISNFLSAEIEYSIQDVDTLQTRSSQAIAINNKGQILGWYNIEKSDANRQFFLRNRDGVFYELPAKEPSPGLPINWQYLTDDGKVYGTFDVNNATRALCVWDQQSGIVKLGVLPGKEIAAINNSGQVLIKSIVDHENGKAVQRPAIWKNGQVTKLKGLNGELGIESEESYGFAMNNKGEVVGQSLTYLVYKNEVYKKVHATKWVNGQAIDMHKKVPKTDQSSAVAINDLGDVLIHAGHNAGYFIRSDNTITNFDVSNKKLNNAYICSGRYITDRNNNWTNIGSISQKIINDTNSIWLSIDTIIDVNEKGEAIASGKTIYGEQHIMLLVPVKPN